MDIAEERQRLLNDLWTGDYRAAVGELSASNQNLVELLSHQSDDVNSTARLTPLVSVWPRFESALTSLFRSRSQKTVTLFSAALSVRLRHNRTPRQTWEAVQFFSKVVSSPQWTAQLCQDALACDPGAPYPTMSGVSAATLDNFSMQVGYQSMVTTDVQSRGYKLDMTNWASILLAASAIPSGTVCIQSMLGTGGLFRHDLSLDAFISKFSQHAAATVANRSRRWREMLDRANGVGVPLLKKSVAQSTFPRTHLHYHDPIFDRLQASYDDVNFEIDLIRNSIYHKHSGAIFIGGDGLTYHRMISRLSQDPRLYLQRTPVVIPVLGEHPHGTHHVLHGGWRLWWPLLEQFAIQIDSKQVVADPEVSVFNKHEFFLRICIRACAEYVLDISKTGADYRLPSQFLQAAEANLSFSYICQFLYLYGFMFLQMRDAVRENNSPLLDLIWCENLATARAAGKTNYGIMSVVRVYWGVAIREPLAALYHAFRSLRWVHTHVGWDMFIEVLNGIIRGSVAVNITQDSLRKFISELNFTSVVNRAIDDIIKSNRERDAGKVKKIEDAVKVIKDFITASIGRDWATATTPSDANLLGLDTSIWGGGRNARQHTPWARMARAMSGDHDYRPYVKEKLGEYCPWHQWQ